MRTLVSIPNNVLKAAESLARRMKKARSQLFSDAVEEYVARHSAKDVAEGWIEPALNWDTLQTSLYHRLPVAFLSEANGDVATSSSVDDLPSNTKQGICS